MITMRTTGGFARPFTPVQPVGAAFATAFLLAGVLGFIPGATGGDLGLLPGDGTAALAGLLPVSIVQNVVHVVLGLVGLRAARSGTATRGVLLAGGGVAFATAVLPATVVAAGLVALAALMVACALLVRGRPVVTARRGVTA